MSDSSSNLAVRRRRPWAAIVAIIVTALACAAALLFRAPLRGRYWAWQLARNATPTQDSSYLTALCNLGDDARWGTLALLQSPNAEVRQFGVLVAQHVPSAWARAALLACLTDPDPYVQHLAAIGLAVHGDESVIPTLKKLYGDNDADAAASACLALQYLGTERSIAALGELAAQPADAAHHAALVDALAAIGRPECVPALELLRADDRPYAPPAATVIVGERALRALMGTGRAPVAATQPESAPAETIADRATAALQRIAARQAAESPH